MYLLPINNWSKLQISLKSICPSWPGRNLDENQRERKVADTLDLGNLSGGVCKLVISAIEVAIYIISEVRWFFFLFHFASRNFDAFLAHAHMCGDHMKGKEHNREDI